MKTNFTIFKLIFSTIPVVIILVILTSTTIPQNNINKNIPYGLKQDQISGLRDGNGNYISENTAIDSFQTIILPGGSSVSDAGDINGNGYDDFIVGASDGRAYIYFGGMNFCNIPDVILSGFGASVSKAGNVNGDGYDDVMISGNGNVYIFYGGTGMDTIPDVILYPQSPGDGFGYSISDAGDVNGDGYDDVIVGAHAYGGYIGRAYVFFGGSSMDNTADVIMTGDTTYTTRFGLAVSGAGDVNGDDYYDVIVGAPQGVGKAYIFYGDESMDDSADVILARDSFNDFGSTLSDAGDVNADGYDDVIVSTTWSYFNVIAFFVFYGSPAMDPNPDKTGIIWEAVGSLVSSAGDINGDGYSDVMVKVVTYIFPISFDSQIFIYYGGSDFLTPDIVLSGETGGGYGATLSDAGDVNSDGYSDLIAGDPTFQKAYLYLSGENPAACIITGNIKAAIEGFLNINSEQHNMRDTLTAYLRNSIAPYSMVDSARAVIDSVNLTGSFVFNNAFNGMFYLVIKHRNALETWSKLSSEVIDTGSTFYYDFTASASKAYGNNLVQVGSKYCMLSGDVNQDGVIDLDDITIVNNDITNFKTGYIDTDLNGDNMADINDILIAYNNSSGFVNLKRP